MYQSSPRMSPSCYLSKCRAASFIKGIPLAKNIFYMYVDFNVLAVACSDGGAGGARHTLAPKKKAGKKDVDLRPHTYVRTRGTKYRC